MGHGRKPRMATVISLFFFSGFQVTAIHCFFLGGCQQSWTFPFLAMAFSRFFSSLSLKTFLFWLQPVSLVFIVSGLTYKHFLFWPRSWACSNYSHKLFFWISGYRVKIFLVIRYQVHFLLFLFPVFDIRHWIDGDHRGLQVNIQQ